MKHVYHVLSYIAKNNPWYEIPLRIWDALVFQISKRLFPRVRVKTLLNGKKIYLYPNNPICSAFVYSSMPDRAGIDFLAQHADKSTVFLDVGANIGAYSLLLSDKVKCVYAFEAHPDTAKLCQDNFALNHIDAQYVLPYAVSFDNEPKYFTNHKHGSPINSRADSEIDTIQIPSITLDQFIDDKGFPDHIEFLIKMDVEGFEHEVFSGAQELLKHKRVKALIFENFSPKYHKIISSLNNFGYSVSLLDDNNSCAVRAL